MSMSVLHWFHVILQQYWHFVLFVIGGSCQNEPLNRKGGFLFIVWAKTHFHLNYCCFIFVYICNCSTRTLKNINILYCKVYIGDIFEPQTPMCKYCWVFTDEIKTYVPKPYVCFFVCQHSSTCTRIAFVQDSYGGKNNNNNNYKIYLDTTNCYL